MRKTLTAVVLTIAIALVTVGCGGTSSSKTQAAHNSTKPTAASNTAKICDALVPWALDLTDEHDPITAKYVALLDDDSAFPPQERVKIRHAYYHEQELKIRQLAETATDPQVATLLNNFADSWAVLASNTSVDGPATIQPFRGPIDTACPGIEHRIAMAAEARGN